MWGLTGYEHVLVSSLIDRAWLCELVLVGTVLLKKGEKNGGRTREKWNGQRGRGRRKGAGEEGKEKSLPGLIYGVSAQYQDSATTPSEAWEYWQPLLSSLQREPLQCR